MSRNVPRIGFVGVGWIGRHRMQSLLKTGLVEAVAVLDASPQAAGEALRLAPRAQRVDTLREMLKHDVDGVVVATPNALHAEQCLEAFEAGAHVFCQKPLGRTAAEVKTIVEAARKHDRLLGVDLSYRHVAGMRDIRDRICAGDVGEVYAMDLVFHNAYGPDKAWFYDPELSGGGCVLDLGIHLVDLALWALDFPRVTGVTSRLYSQGRPIDTPHKAVEDHAAWRLDLENGASATMACSWRGSHGRDAVIAATFHGVKGSLRLENVGGSFFDFRSERLQGTRATTLTEPPDDWSGRAIEAWARRLVERPRHDPECARHIDVMEVLDRVYSP